MTRQHFEEFAIEVNNMAPCDRLKTYYIIARVAERFNPRFNRLQFKKACGI